MLDPGQVNSGYIKSMNMNLTLKCLLLSLCITLQHIVPVTCHINEKLIHNLFFKQPGGLKRPYWELLSCQQLTIPKQHIAKYERLIEKQINKHNKPRSDIEWLAFHGTNQNHIENIVSNGFNPSLCKRSAYGYGTYFSCFAHTACYYSHTATGVTQFDYKRKHMLLCRLVAAFPNELGFQPNQWKVSSKHNTKNEKMLQLEDEFDSFILTRYNEPAFVRNMIGNAEEICIRYPFQAIPTHLIEFQKIKQTND